jgi:iron-sulfur cluster repair protein YtfE (RIC family)
MDAIEMLEKDHQKVTELFRRFNGGGGLTGLVKRVTGNVPDRQRRQAADQICRELEMHTTIEEEIFYPGVRALNDDRLNGMLAEAFKEHATVKEHVATIRNGIGVDSDLQSKMNELQSDVDHHVREEENEMFPRVELLMDAPRRDQLARDMRARKQQIQPTRARARRRAAATRTRARTRRRTAAAAKKRKRVRTTARARARARGRRGR